MNTKALIAEVTFKAIRSSGAGGQHVNKVYSKVVLVFNIESSKILTTNQKALLIGRLSSRIYKEGILQLSCDDSRSQYRNKKEVADRFLALIEEGLKVAKPRKKSSPKRTAILKSKKAKQMLSLKKSLRRKPSIERH